MADLASLLDALALASSGVPVAGLALESAVTFSWGSAEALAAFVVPVFIGWA